MEHKYENVIAKRDFEVPRFDENKELVGMVTVPKGCKGIIESMRFNPLENFKISYDIRFIEDDKEIEVSIYKEDWELYLEDLISS